MKNQIRHCRSAASAAPRRLTLSALAERARAGLANEPTSDFTNRLKRALARYDAAMRHTKDRAQPDADGDCNA